MSFFVVTLVTLDHIAIFWDPKDLGWKKMLPRKLNLIMTIRWKLCSDRSRRLDKLSRSSFMKKEKNLSCDPSDSFESSSKLKRIWVKKNDHISLVAHTLLKVFDFCYWYLDCACSRHMSMDKSVFWTVQWVQGWQCHFWRYESVTSQRQGHCGYWGSTKALCSTLCERSKGKLA